MELKFQKFYENNNFYTKEQKRDILKIKNVCNKAYNELIEYTIEINDNDFSKRQGIKRLELNEVEKILEACEEEYGAITNLGEELVRRIIYDCEGDYNRVKDILEARIV